MSFDLKKCDICPRNCGADRLGGGLGFCAQGAAVKAARAGLHFWEEPCISGENGSGTVFFSGCVLKCSFCQNSAISAGGFGAEISTERLAEIFCQLQAQKAHNLNLVSPTQFTPQILEALKLAKAAGFSLPVVWNTGGYEKAETIAALEGAVDIFLTDFKFMDSALAERFCAAADYPQRAMEALREMARITGAPVFDGGGMMRRGVIVRHLAMPGCIKDSRAVLKWLREQFGEDIYISLMSQYTPPPVPDGKSPERRLHRAEYRRIVDFAVEMGIERAFVQELSSAEGEYVPEFDLTGIVK